MKKNTWMLIPMIIEILSCNNGADYTQNGEQMNQALPPPKTIESMTTKGQIGLIWEAIPGASGYVVSYGTTYDYEFFVETTEPRVIIYEVDLAQTWYIAVQTKNGETVGSLPQTPLIIWGLAVPDISINSGEKSQPADEPERFTYARFMAEKAAWETQQLSHYRFTARLYSGGSLIGPITITVLPHKASGAVDESPDPFFPVTGRTIDELYAYIASNTADLEGYNVWIQYNKQYHYPTFYSKSIYIPPSPDPLDQAGGQGFFEITGFELLE